MRMWRNWQTRFKSSHPHHRAERIQLARRPSTLVAAASTVMSVGKVPWHQPKATLLLFSNASSILFHKRNAAFRVVFGRLSSAISKLRGSLLISRCLFGTLLFSGT